MILLLNKALLTVTGSFELSLLLKATVLAGLALTLLHGLSRARASVRHLVLSTMFGALLLLPLLTVLLPTVAIHVAVSDPATVARVVTDETPVQSNGVRDPGPYPPAASTTQQAISPRSLLQAGWLVGAFIFAIPLITSLWRLRSLHRRATMWPDGQRLGQELAFHRGISRSVHVLVHEGVSIPLTWRNRKPVILLPADVASWSEPDLRRTLAHELEHVRRRDWLVHLTARGVCAVYWFHPFIWLAWRRLGLEAERTCDDGVLTGNDHVDYADQLVRLAQRMSTRGSAQGALAMMSRSHLSTRVAAVLDADQSRGRAGWRRTTLTVVVAGALLVALAPLTATGRLPVPQTSIGPRIQPPPAAIDTSAAAQTTEPGKAPQPAPVRRARAVPTNHEREQSVTTQAPARMAFDVSSVKANTSGRAGVQMHQVTGDGITVINATVQRLIQEAYGVQTYQIVGGPSWLTTESFDVTGKAAASHTSNELRSMLRTLLADRFSLVAHPETKTTPVFALVVAGTDGELGRNLRRGTIDCATRRAIYAREGRTPGPGNLPCGGLVTQIGRFVALGLEMKALAGMLSPEAGRLVVDKTALDGIFDWDLTYTPDRLVGHAPDRFPAVDPNGPSLFTAVQEQLGLKLEPQDTLGEILVIDQVERPIADTVLLR